MNKSIMLIAGMFGGFDRTVSRAPRQINPKAKILRVLAITAGKHHAWCESDQGRIRKPVESIPQALVNEYLSEVGEVWKGE